MKEVEGCVISIWHNKSEGLVQTSKLYLIKKINQNKSFSIEILCKEFISKIIAVLKYTWIWGIHVCMCTQHFTKFFMQK